MDQLGELDTARFGCLLAKEGDAPKVGPRPAQLLRVVFREQGKDPLFQECFANQSVPQLSLPALLSHSEKLALVKLWSLRLGIPLFVLLHDVQALLRMSLLHRELYTIIRCLN